MGIRTHYDNLQIARSASASVIRAAYKALSQQHHPDKNPENVERAHQRMKIINAAYKVLSDPVRRAEHDRWIKDAEDSDNNATATSRAAEAAEAAEKLRREREYEAARRDEEIRRRHTQQGPSQDVAAAAGVASRELRPASRKSLRLRYWLIAAICVRLAWPDQSSVKTTVSNPPLPTLTQASHTATTRTETAAEKAARLNQLYADEVRALESKFVWLNPEAPEFRKDLVQEALQSKELYEGQGIAPHIAVRRAVADVASVRQGWNLKSLPNVAGRRWKLIFSGPSEKTFIDMRSVNGDVLEREFLLKHYYSVAEKVIEEGAGNAPMYYVTAMERYFMRCSDRSAAQGFTRYYSISGLEVIDPGRWARNARRDMNKTFTTIPTNDIMMDAAFNIVCPPLMKSISDSGLF